MAINTKLMRKVAQSIRSEERMKYEQGAWFKHLLDDEGEECGTAGCVAGHTVFVANNDKLLRLGTMTVDCIQTEASSALGLSEGQADALFCGCPGQFSLEHQFDMPEGSIPQQELQECVVSPKWMAKVLETIADHYDKVQS